MIVHISVSRYSLRGFSLHSLIVCVQTFIQIFTLDDIASSSSSVGRARVCLNSEAHGSCTIFVHLLIILKARAIVARLVLDPIRPKSSTLIQITVSILLEIGSWLACVRNVTIPILLASIECETRKVSCCTVGPLVHITSLAVRMHVLRRFYTSDVNNRI